MSRDGSVGCVKTDVGTDSCQVRHPSTYLGADSGSLDDGYRKTELESGRWWVDYYGHDAVGRGGRRLSESKWRCSVKPNRKVRSKSQRPGLRLILNLGSIIGANDRVILTVY